MNMTYTLAAGAVHPVEVTGLLDGYADPGAEVLCVSPSSLDLTDSVPGSDFEFTGTATIKFGDGTTQTIALSGFIIVGEAAAVAPVEEPAAVVETEAPAPPAEEAPVHSYSAALAFG